jgi:hypothetical protein
MNSVQNTVISSEIVNSLPISDVPTSGASHKLPNAHIVVAALKTTPRAVDDCK